MIDLIPSLPGKLMLQATMENGPVAISQIPNDVIERKKTELIKLLMEDFELLVQTIINIAIENSFAIEGTYFFE